MNFDVLFLDINCGGASILKVIKFLWILLDYAMFIIPIGLIIMIMVDMAKSVISSSTDDMNKNGKIAIKRVIFAMSIFLIPSIINTSINLLGGLGVDYAICLKTAKTEKNLSKYEAYYEKGSFGNHTIVIPDNLKQEKYKKKNTNSLNGNSNSSTSTNKVDSTLKNNIAAVIAMEQGCTSEKQYLKYITTAIYINNYYMRNNNTNITKEGLYKTNVGYSKSYNDLTLEGVEPHRGKMSDEDKKRCLKIVDDILDKKFTIPKNVVFAAAPYVVLTYGTIWGQEDLTGGTWPVAVGYSGTIDETDVYGKKVTTSWDETVKKAKKLYE